MVAGWTLKNKKYLALPQHGKWNYMKLQNTTGEIINSRKVYYVAIYNESNEITAFLGSDLHYGSTRVDSALFDNKEEAEELMNKAELSGIQNTIPHYAKMAVLHDTQYQIQVWRF